MHDARDMGLQKASFDLHQVIVLAPKQFPIEEIYFFGSRRFNTRSLRSDIDLFFVPNDHIKPADVREFIDQTCKALDIFILNRGSAVSAVNESFIEFENNEALLDSTQALLLWSRTHGVTNEKSIVWIQEYAEHVEFVKTALPNLILTESIDRLKARLSHQGLPTDPIVGDSEEGIALRLLEIAKTVAEFKISDFPGKGAARSSFVVQPKSEYDFQDIFWICAKPWIGGIAREQVEMMFDGQKKKSDFSLMKSRFIIEMKYARNDDDKRAIVKTLDGLTSFYEEHPNVRFLLFIIYAHKDAQIDRTLWESRYSRTEQHIRVLLKVVPIN